MFYGSVFCTEKSGVTSSKLTFKLRSFVEKFTINKQKLKEYCFSDLRLT